MTDTDEARAGAGPRPDRSSAAERAADELRRRITEGELTPQARLAEESLVEVLHVSRNTLRESFRLLTHEGLLVYRLNRGVFVPELDEDDLVDLYRLRRAIECDAVRTLRDLDETRLQPLRDDVADGEASARRGDWRQVGTANMTFHRHLVGLAGSRRIDEVTARLLAELRLAFHIIDIPQELHEPYVARNRALVDLLTAGDVAGAAAALEAYLLDSEARLLKALRERRAPSGGNTADADR